MSSRKPHAHQRLSTSTHLLNSTHFGLAFLSFFLCLRALSDSLTCRVGDDCKSCLGEKWRSEKRIRNFVKFEILYVEKFSVIYFLNLDIH